ncbi:MAG: class I SAM-dependent methyltransferase [Promethearchaeota archaeon]
MHSNGREEWLKKPNIEYHERQFKNPYRSTVHFCDFLEEQNVMEQGRIIDIGAGLGANIKYMAERFPNISFTGIELNAHLVEIGNRFLRKECINNCKLIQGDLYNLDNIFIEKFDGVVSYQTLSWLPEYETALQKMIKLNPKWIGITSLFYEGPINTTILIQDYSQKVGKKPFLESYYNIYSLDLIEQLLTENKFTIFKYKPFEIDIDLEQPKTRRMGTYTIKTIEGKRLQISGPLLMSWYFVFASK